MQTITAAGLARNVGQKVVLGKYEHGQPLDILTAVRWDDGTVDYLRETNLSDPNRQRGGGGGGGTKCFHRGDMISIQYKSGRTVQYRVII